MFGPRLVPLVFCSSWKIQLNLPPWATVPASRATNGESETSLRMQSARGTIATHKKARTPLKDPADHAGRSVIPRGETGEATHMRVSRCASRASIQVKNRVPPCSVRSQKRVFGEKTDENCTKSWRGGCSLVHDFSPLFPQSPILHRLNSGVPWCLLRSSSSPSNWLSDIRNRNIVYLCIDIKGILESHWSVLEMNYGVLQEKDIKRINLPYWGPHGPRCTATKQSNPEPRRCWGNWILEHPDVQLGQIQFYL